MANKKVKKKSKRGGWSTKPIVALQFANLNKIDRGGDSVKITPTGIYMSESQGAKLELDAKSYLLIAVENGLIYLAKKPKGVFGGHRVVWQKRSKRPFVSLKTSKFGLKIGTYLLGKSVRTELKGEMNEKVRFDAFALNPL